MLLGPARLDERRLLARGVFAPLAGSLARDLAPLAHSDDIYIPETKARLTRAGGRCPSCGSMLDFDPSSPTRHRCSRCNREVVGEEHDLMWIMWYQLWLAERALHAAALFGVAGDPTHRSLAERILSRYADQYLSYPNRDNVLGPTRVFFSTYLESIWTLQLACALDVLERAGIDRALGAKVRDRLLLPSAALIAQYDEGLSNRQVWNNAALLAVARLSNDLGAADQAVHGPSGLLVHLQRCLLADGTWYEGENYHLFAHRGLWYGVTLAERAGFDIPEALRSRYRRAFETPFLTALPDFSFPSRRDSQYRVSLRQWRIAESCELGLVESPSSILAAALRELYREDLPRGETGRAVSTAEAERNVPASSLTRADLGWKSLLFAAPSIPSVVASHTAAQSVLLPEQGFAVLRRNSGKTYVALDYGESGGGHGHPDRLNLWLVVGEARVLEDVGTGSYVDPTLHWYRSSLAHNAPFAGGHSQVRADGELLGYDERGDFGWTLARVAIAPNVEVERAVVVADSYLVDELSWTGTADTVLDLPYHIAASAPSLAFQDAPISGGHALEDGFDAISASARSEPMSEATITGEVQGIPVSIWLNADAPFVLWRLRGPGPPNEPPRDFFLVRSSGVSGRLRSVIAWANAVTDMRATGEALFLTLRDGARHEHARREDEWRIAIQAPDGNTAAVTLAPARPPHTAHRPVYTPPSLMTLMPAIDVPRIARAEGEPGELPIPQKSRIQLGIAHYRRSEQSWDEAGRPRATIAMAATPTELYIDIIVEKLSVAFAVARAVNPLDNEHPDINSDGVQLYLAGVNAAGQQRSTSWILVPEVPAPNVRITLRETTNGESAAPIVASWRPMARGYVMRVSVPLEAFASDGSFFGDVIINEMPPPPERERRRGQLVLSGGRGEWIYLRGDRQDASRYLRFVITNA
jgi:heparinase II/III-like protein